MKNLERKKKEEKNKYENALLQSHNTTCRCEPLYQISYTVVEISLMKNLKFLS